MEGAGGGSMTFKITPKHLAILKQAGIPVDPYKRNIPKVIQRLCQKLYDGVFLEHGTLKYWVDREKKRDCYFMYAQALQITSSDDTSYWQWHADHNKDAEPEVAELVQAMWLEVKGKFDTVKLCPNTKYHVSFIVKLKDTDMRGLPLTLKLVLPDGTRRENQQSVAEVDKWVKLVAGEFSTHSSNIGVMEFSLEDLEQSWKSGLIVKGAEIKPVD